MTLENYEPVSARLDRWLKVHEGDDARVLTHMVSEPGADICVFRAELWVNSLLISTGWAEEIRGQGNVNRTSHVENCETSAIGRALANAGMAGSDYSKRPSREEMAKVQRAEAGAPPRVARGDGPVTITNKIPGKCGKCLVTVPAGDGIATKEDGKWRTYHRDGECIPEDPF